MIQCRNCKTKYNETFTQCPFCGTRNPMLVQTEKGFVIFDKISLVGKDIEKVKEISPNEVTTVVSFHIPFLLHLLNGIYEMKYNNRWIVFQLARVNESPEYTSRFFGIAMTPPSNAEIPKDRFGRLAHTHLSIFIPWKIMDDPNTSVFECPKCRTELSSSSSPCSVCGADFKEEEAKHPAHSIIKKTAITLFNRFLEAYRFYSHEYHIEPIKNADIISFECDYVYQKKTLAGYKYLVDTGSGGIKGGEAFIVDDNIHNRLRDFLKSGKRVDVQELLLCNAKNHLLAEEYPLALIESVSAMDIVLSEFIRKEGDRVGISKDGIEKFIHDVGISGQVKVVLKLLTKNESQLPNDVYSDCEGAITLRNNVVHEGLLELDPINVKRRMGSIERLMRYAQAILEKHSKVP